MSSAVMISAWLFGSNGNRFASPHFLISWLSSSSIPSGTDTSGTFGTLSMSSCQSAITSLSSSSSFWISSLSVFISPMSSCFAASSFAETTSPDTRFCSAFFASIDLRSSRRLSSVDTNLSRLTSICFLRAPSRTSSRFSLMNLISSMCVNST